MAGQLLLPQIVYGGKTNRCHPDVEFPHDWHITHSINHWSNTETMLEYCDQILIPYVQRVWRSHGLPRDFKAVALFDVFAAHRTDVFLDKLKSANINPVFVPGSCTGELQPLDVAFNGDFKRIMKDQFSNFYAQAVENGLSEGKEMKDIKVDLSTY